MTTKLFNDIADYYDAFRPGIPEEVVDYLRARFGIDAASWVVDLGCGTGQTARALCGHVDRVVCVDNDEEMVRVAASTLGAQAQCSGKTVLVCGEAEDYIPDRKVDLVTVSRAFHWMDQDKVLTNCRSFVRSGGGVALLGDSSLWNGSEAWQKTVKQTIQAFLGEQRRAGNSNYAVTDEPYESMLDRHGYVLIEVRDFELVRQWTLDAILGYLYSTSFSSRRMFGDRLEAFERTLANALGDPDAEHTFEERTSFTVKSGRVP